MCWDLAVVEKAQGLMAYGADFPDLPERWGDLALQLHFSSKVSAASVGLMSSPPERPCENTVDRDAPLSELDSDATDFLDRPADQERRLVCRRGGVFLGAGSVLARWRMTAIMAKASMTRETWRCQPCQERVSL